MSRYRKILVPFDGSASAKNALSLACRLAGKEKSWIKVLAVFPTFQGDLELVGVRNLRETIDGPGEKLLAEAREIAKMEETHILTDLKQGEPYERIVRVAAEENCDLIVMGRRGRGQGERAFMGSVTERVIGHTDRDVLVVPEGGELAWGHLLLATDGSASSDHALARSLEISQEEKARLSVVSVVYTNDEFYALGQEQVKELYAKADKILDKVTSWAGDLGVKAEAFIRDGEPHEAVASLAGELRTDLIIMGSHGRKGLSRLLMGSVTERVIGFAPCPVLVCH